jgi:hypothetical protein
VPILPVRRGRWSCAGCIAALALAGLVGCGSNGDSPSYRHAYQRGQDAGKGGEVRGLVQQGKLPVEACDQIERADKAGVNYSFDDAAGYRQGCLDALRAEGIRPRAGF